MADPISSNVSQLVNSFWTEGFPILIDKAAPFIKILQTVGIVFIAYLIFLIVKSILAMRDHRRLVRVEQKVDLILGKLGLKEKSFKKFVVKSEPLKNKKGKKKK